MFSQALAFVGTAVRSLIGGETTPPPETVASPNGGRRRASNRQAGEILKRQKSKEIAAGTVHLFGLCSIRAELGDEWEAVADQAYAVTQKIISRHLTDADVFERRDEETYILCFADLTPKEAEMKVRSMSQEIKDTLLKEVPQAAAVVEVGHHVAALAPDTIQDGGESVLDAIAGSLEQIKRDAEQTFQRKQDALLKQANVIYSPVWNPKKRTILMNRCQLDDATSRLTLNNLLTLSDDGKAQKVMSDIDGILLGCAIRDLHTLLQANERVMFLIPINFYTLGFKATRETHLALCEKIPEAYRQYVTFEISGIPSKTPASRLLAMAAWLQPYCHGVVVEMSPGGMAIGEFASGGIFGVSLTHTPSSDAFDEGAMTSLNTAFALGLRTMVHGVCTAGLLKAAVDANIHYMDGDAIAPKTDTPKGARKLYLSLGHDDGDPMSRHIQASDRTTAVS